MRQQNSILRANNKVWTNRSLSRATKQTCRSPEPVLYAGLKLEIRGSDRPGIASPLLSGEGFIKTGDGRNETQLESQKTGTDDLSAPTLYSTREVLFSSDIPSSLDVLLSPISATASGARLHRKGVSARGRLPSQSLSGFPRDEANRGQSA